MDETTGFFGIIGTIVLAAFTRSFNKPGPAPPPGSSFLVRVQHWMLSSRCWLYFQRFVVVQVLGFIYDSMNHPGRAVQWPPKRLLQTVIFDCVIAGFMTATENRDKEDK